MVGMADYRRARGNLVDPAVLGFEVERERRERFKTIASSSKLSAAVLFELVVDHLETELTEDGVPTWLPKTNRDRELPIDAA